MTLERAAGLIRHMKSRPLSSIRSSLLGKPTDLWWLVPLAILTVGLTARLVATGADWLHADNYGFMYRVDEPFREYVGQFGALGIQLHYWFSYRLFGDSLISYMIFPLISSLATLLVVYWGLRHQCRSSPALCFFALLVLAYNSHQIHFVQYAIWPYASSILLSSCLFFLFLRLSQGKITTKNWVWFMVLAGPLAFFAITSIIVPIAAGVVSVALVRYFRLHGYHSLGSVVRSLLEMWPLVVFPILQLVHLVLRPAVYSAALSNPHLDPHFFGRAAYPMDLGGAAHFVLDNSYALIKDLFMSSPLTHFTQIWPWVTTALLLVMAVLGIQMWRRRLDSRIAFALVFTVITVGALIAGALLGVTPYGRARDAYYLLLPLAILIGYAASSLIPLVSSTVVRALPPRRRKVETKAVPPIAAKSAPKTLRWWKLVPILMAIAILVLGTTWNIDDWRHNNSVTERNRAVLHAFESAQVDLAFYAATRREVLRVATPQLWENAINIGHGINPRGGPEDVVPEDMVEILADSTGTDGVLTVLLIGNSEFYLVRFHPAWHKLISTSYHKIEEFRAPSIWGAIYERSAPLEAIPTSGFLYFDGTRDIRRELPHKDVKDFTVELFFRSDTPPDQDYSYGRASPPMPLLFLPLMSMYQRSEDQIHVLIGPNPASPVKIITLYNDDWVNLALTVKDGKEMIVYVNGYPYDRIEGDFALGDAVTIGRGFHERFWQGWIHYLVITEGILYDGAYSPSLTPVETEETLLCIKGET